MSASTRIYKPAEAAKNGTKAKYPQTTKHPVTPSPAALPADPLQSPYFYDAGRKEYLAKNARGAWLSYPVSEFKRILRAAGYHTRAGQDEPLSSADRAILHLQNYCDVAYAGALAGYREGFHEISGQRVLVTRAPRLIEPVAGEWPTLTALFGGLLGDDADDEQIPFFFGWVKVAYEALRAGKRRPGQALVLAGPRDCGKSLLQNLLTLIFGGRAAKPYRYMTGETTFNSDLFAAEHLIIEDEQPNTDLRARRNFGAQIKSIGFNETQSCHGKHREALTLTPFWRLSISLNDEPENLLVLPPLDESLGDKLMLLRARRRPLPMPTHTPEERERFWSTLAGELPAFLHFLQGWEIPSALACQRCGVRYFHHPAILESIGALDPARRLLELIDATLFPTSGGHALEEPWEGAAVELERKLTEPVAALAHEARRLLYFSTACGVYLARLAAPRGAGAGRLDYRETKRGRRWHIAPPGKLADMGSAEAEPVTG